MVGFIRARFVWTLGLSRSEVGRASSTEPLLPAIREPESFETQRAPRPHRLAHKFTRESMGRRGLIDLCIYLCEGRGAPKPHRPEKMFNTNPRDPETSSNCL